MKKQKKQELRQVLRCGEVVFTGTYEKCLAYCKENGLFQYVPYWNDWMFVGDCDII